MYLYTVVNEELLNIRELFYPTALPSQFPYDRLIYLTSMCNE